LIESGATKETRISCAAGNCPGRITCGGDMCQVSCNGLACSGGVCCKADECNLGEVADDCP
jgi:hypothetical protein